VMMSPAILGWMSALSDPTRARLLRLVEHRELAVAELCEVLQLPQSTVSRHLKVLSDDGWVSSRPEGTSRLYRMSVDGKASAARRLWGLLRDQLAEVPAAHSDDERLERVLAARQSRSQAFFASAAGQWDRLREELFGRALDARALPALLDERWGVGDLGCGTGGLSEALAPFVRRVVAVDGSPAMLKAARARLADHPNVEIRRGELEALPIADGELDAALFALVLHHVTEPPRALAEACRVLKPGGRLVVVDMQPHDRHEYREKMGHVWLGFPREQLLPWFESAGFERARSTPLRPDPQARGPGLFAATAVRAHRRRLGAGE
jgi:ubiquinone/menaquinone biosynthesis C-methylase UbiE/DNA-binding MarR family transcriptional regulator